MPDLIVTMACGVSDFCLGPFFKENVDWEFEDPKGKFIDKVREIRDEIELRVHKLVAVEKQFFRKEIDPFLSQS